MTLWVCEIGIFEKFFFLSEPFWKLSPLKITAKGTRKAKIINVNKVAVACSFSKKLHVDEGKHGSIVG